MIDEDYDEAYDGPSAEDDPWLTTIKHKIV